MLRFIPNCNKDQKLCDIAVDNYSHALRFVPECYKTQKMCNKNVGTYPSTIRFAPECYKSQEICNKAVGTYPSAIRFVPECYMSQQMSNKAVDICPFVFDSVPVQSSLQKNCFDKYKTREMCDKAADSNLVILKFVSEWFLISKMIKKLGNAVSSNDDIVFGGIDSDIVTFFSNDVGFYSINLNNVNPDDVNFDDYDPKTINHVRLMAWYNRYKQHKAFKKR